MAIAERTRRAGRRGLGVELQGRGDDLIGEGVGDLGLDPQGDDDGDPLLKRGGEVAVLLAALSVDANVWRGLGDGHAGRDRRSRRANQQSPP